jgi:hypothetical protein
MTTLVFDVLGVVPELYAVSPQLTAKLRVTETDGEQVHALALRAQVRVDAHRRPYSDVEAAGLLDLFGPRERWSQTLKPFLWMQTSTMVQGFTGACDADLPLPCTYDIEVSGAKYFQALRDGTIGLEFLFSGTVFTKGSTGFEVTQIPWDREARYDMPVAVWHAMIDQHFPGAGWVRAHRETIDALAAFRSARGLTSWDETLTVLMAEAGQVTR